MNRAFQITILAGAAALVACANQALVKNNEGLAKLNAGDCATAYPLLQQAEVAGVACAKNNVGVILLRGCPAVGVSQDFGAALVKFENAALLGCPIANANAGDMYLLGRGVARDRAKAATFYETGARWGEATAISRLRAMKIDPPYPDLKQGAADAQAARREAQSKNTNSALEVLGELFGLAGQAYGNAQTERAGRVAPNGQVPQISSAGCSSDFDCGYGSVCVKVRQSTDYYGQCYKSLDRNGNPNYPTQQTTMHLYNGCQLDTQCNMTSGYRCVIPSGQIYGVCLKQ